MRTKLITMYLTRLLLDGKTKNQKKREKQKMHDFPQLDNQKFYLVNFPTSKVSGNIRGFALTRTVLLILGINGIMKLLNTHRNSTEMSISINKHTH